MRLRTFFEEVLFRVTVDTACAKILKLERTWHVTGAVRALPLNSGDGV
jgi:hypothetical protein